MRKLEAERFADHKTYITIAEPLGSGRELSVKIQEFEPVEEAESEGDTRASES